MPGPTRTPGPRDRRDSISPVWPEPATAPTPVTDLRLAIKDWLPPKALRLVSRLRGRSVTFVEGFSTWQGAASASTGYDSNPILEKSLNAALAVRRGEAAYERDSVLFAEPAVNWPLATYLCLAAARNQGHLRVLDFGGGLGSTYFQHRSFLGQLSSVAWGVVEQPHFVQAGREHLQQGELSFHSSIEDCFARLRPSIVVFSSVVQYLPDPFGVLEHVRARGTDLMVIDRTPFHTATHDQVMVQKVPKWIYKASYPLWIFSETSFISRLDRDWRLISGHPCPEGDARGSSGTRFTFKGLAFEARK